MEPTEENVIEAVRRREPTTPSEVANDFCDESGSPEEVSDRYQDLEEEIRDLMVKLADKDRLRIDIDWKFRTCDTKRVKSRILGFIH